MVAPEATLLACPPPMALPLEKAPAPSEIRLLFPPETTELSLCVCDTPPVLGSTKELAAAMLLLCPPATMEDVAEEDTPLAMELLFPPPIDAAVAVEENP
jgi:hypothetical protein